MDRRGDSLQGLAHVVVEAEMSRDLLSASWRPRTAGGAVRFDSKGLRTEGPVVSAGVECESPKSTCWCLRAGDGGLSSGRECEVTLPLPFVLFGPSVAWTRPTALGRAGSFTQSSESKIQVTVSPQDSVLQTAWAPLRPGRLAWNQPSLSLCLWSGLAGCSGGNAPVSAQRSAEGCPGHGPGAVSPSHPDSCSFLS